MQKPLTTKETMVIKTSLRAHLKQCISARDIYSLDKEELEFLNEKIEVIKDLLDNL